MSGGGRGDGEGARVAMSKQSGRDTVSGPTASDAAACSFSRGGGRCLGPAKYCAQRHRMPLV